MYNNTSTIKLLSLGYAALHWDNYYGNGDFGESLIVICGVDKAQLSHRLFQRWVCITLRWCRKMFII